MGLSPLDDIDVEMASVVFTDWLLHMAVRYACLQCTCYPCVVLRVARLLKVRSEGNTEANNRRQTSSPMMPSSSFLTPLQPPLPACRRQSFKSLRGTLAALLTNLATCCLFPDLTTRWKGQTRRKEKSGRQTLLRHQGVTSPWLPGLRTENSCWRISALGIRARTRPSLTRGFRKYA